MKCDTLLPGEGRLCVIEGAIMEKNENHNLLILGAGVYGLVAKEIAESMGTFGKIAFIDDNAKTAPDGLPVIGRFSDVETLAVEYGNAIVAIGNPEARLRLIRTIEESGACRVVPLISPHAYVSPTVQIEKGCIIEPMAVIHTGCKLGTGCIVSAGAVINHVSQCCNGVHIDCNATVAGYTCVPQKTKVESGTVYRNQAISAEEMFVPIKNDTPTKQPTGLCRLTD